MSSVFMGCMGIPPELYFAVSVSCTLTCFFLLYSFVWIGLQTINCSKLGGVSEGFFSIGHITILQAPFPSRPLLLALLSYFSSC